MASAAVYLKVKALCAAVRHCNLHVATASLRHIRCLSLVSFIVRRSPHKSHTDHRLDDGGNHADGQKRSWRQMRAASSRPCEFERKQQQALLLEALDAGVTISLNLLKINLSFQIYLHKHANTTICNVFAMVLKLRLEKPVLPCLPCFSSKSC